MNEEWRLEKKLNEGKICLACFSSNNIPISQDVYQFSHDFVESGQLDKYIPSKDNLLQEEVAQFRGDYFKMACDAILKAWNEK